MAASGADALGLDWTIELAEARERLLEAVCESDDAMLEKYLRGQEIEPDEIRAALRKGTIALKLTPVLCGAAFRNKGVQMLLDAVVDYLPDPTEVPPQPEIDLENCNGCGICANCIHGHDR